MWFSIIKSNTEMKLSEQKITLVDSNWTMKIESAMTSGVNGLENMNWEHGVAEQIRSWDVHPEPLQDYITPKDTTPFTWSAQPAQVTAQDGTLAAGRPCGPLRGLHQGRRHPHGGEVELLVPFSSAPLQTEARLLGCCEEALEAINQLLHGDDSRLSGGHTEGHKADQQQACHLVLWPEQAEQVKWR